MKVGALLVCGGWGGAERIACALAQRAVEAGHALHIDAAPLAQQGLLDAGFQCAGGERSLLRWAVAARRRLERFAPDVVHVHLSTPAFSAAAKIAVAGFPRLVTVQLLPEASWPNDFLLPIPSAWSLSSVSSHANGYCIAVSRTDATQLVARLGLGRVRTVSNAPPPEQLAVAARFRFDAEPGTLRLLAVGRLDPQKGWDLLLEALARVRASELDFRLWLVGSGREERPLRELAARLALTERVCFVGDSSWRGLAAEADLMLSTSRYEGLPLVPMEGVLAGCAVLCSAIPPHAELFGGIEGAFLPSDPATWAESISALLGDPARRQRLREAQSARAEGFAFERMWSDYERLYRELSGRARSDQPKSSVSP